MTNVLSENTSLTLGLTISLVVVVATGAWSLRGLYSGMDAQAKEVAVLSQDRKERIQKREALDADNDAFKSRVQSDLRLIKLKLGIRD